MEGSRRRITLYDQMVTVTGDRREIGGLTLNDVLTIQKRASQTNPSPTVQLNTRTLLDVIREDEFHRERNKSWKFLRNRLRFKRIVARSHDMMDFDESPETHSSAPSTTLRPQISRRNSSRFDPITPMPSDPIQPDEGPTRIMRPQMSRHNSTRFSIERENLEDPTEPAREGTRRLSTALAEERALSAREAVAAQEASEAEAAEMEEIEVEPAAETAAPARMSLMDLLEETDRQMGFEGSRYNIEDEEEEEAEAEAEVEEKNENGNEKMKNNGEQNCCVCMVRHKGAAFIPCGHTFCRLCSRELWVSRGNCPLCNGFILEILDIF